MLKRRVPLSSEVSLGSGGALPQRSKKMQRIYEEERIPFVIDFLKRNPVCAAKWEGCLKVATEVNELVLRSRGGSILDPENCCALCHNCHGLITRNPKRAHETGFALSANPSSTEIELARRKRERSD